MARGELLSQSLLAAGCDQGGDKRQPRRGAKHLGGEDTFGGFGVLNTAGQQRPHSGSLNQQLVAVSICSNVDGPRGDHTKRGESDGERQTSYDITCMWNLRNDTMNLFVKQKQTDLENKLLVTKGEVGER